MKKVKEITVLVKDGYDNLHKKLAKQGFKIVEKFQLNDTYLIPKEADIQKTHILDLLTMCVLIRDVVGIEKKIVYKHKKFDKEERIVEQGKVECEIKDVNSAVELFKRIGYVECINIFDTNIVYTNGKIEITVQLVNDKYIFIEMEDKAHHIDSTFDSTEDMIKEFENIDINYDKNNYYVKKAEIIYNDTYKK